MCMENSQCRGKCNSKRPTDSADGDANISPVSRFEILEKIRAVFMKRMAS